MGMWFCFLTYYVRAGFKVSSDASLTAQNKGITKEKNGIMYEQFIGSLSNRLKKTLPGEEKQALMAPASRRKIADIPSENYNPRKSAVLILLFPLNNSMKTVLIQRPEYKGVHSGQVAFPGGKYEDGDKDLMATALRETAEEIGVKEDELKILGNLTELYISPSNFLVTPYIGFLNKVPSFHPDPLEVQKIIVVDLDLLNDISIQGIKTIEHSNGYKIKTPCYEVEGLIVWGATAMIISELNAVVADAKAIF
jgi:8-oxo-dGTP pyrophosphatase MutT (NUDIX family)